MNELKPCPFCGGTEIIQFYADRDGDYVNYCNTCEAKGPPSTDCERPTAHANWNKQASSNKDIRDALDEAAKEISEYDSKWSESGLIQVMDAKDVINNLKSKYKGE